jgi:hypothetical protein
MTADKPGGRAPTSRDRLEQLAEALGQTAGRQAARLTELEQRHCAALDAMCELLIGFEERLYAIEARFASPRLVHDIDAA